MQESTVAPAYPAPLQLGVVGEGQMIAFFVLNKVVFPVLSCDKCCMILFFKIPRLKRLHKKMLVLHVAIFVPAEEALENCIETKHAWKKVLVC